MSVGLTLEELLAWNDEAAKCWKSHLQKNPGLLEVQCDIAGTGTVQGFVRHVWGAELRWAQRLAGLPVLGRDDATTGPLDALFTMHRQAMEVFRGLLNTPNQAWDEVYAIESDPTLKGRVDWIAAELRNPSRRKLAAHTLFHSQRHWSQLSTLARQAGYPAPFRGDLLFSPALR